MISDISYNFVIADGPRSMISSDELPQESKIQWAFKANLKSGYKYSA